jgi:hypothetical protein
MIDIGMFMEDRRHDQLPKIQALGIVQDGPPNRWKATGFVKGIGWLEARGTTMMEAIDALHTRVEKIVSEKATEEEDA